MWRFHQSRRKSEPAGGSFFVRRLSVGIILIGFVSLVVADHATCGGTYLAVSRHVTGDAAHDRALDTPFGIGTPDQSQR